jgi:hypothetical protein
MASKEVILKKTRFIWPIVLFPYYKRGRTLAYTGRHFVKDIRFGASFATLYLTDSKLYCSLIFPHLLIFEIDILDIISVSLVEDKGDVIEIRFTHANYGWLTRFALSGDPAIPRDRLFLNLGNKCETWFENLNRLIVYKGEANKSVQ